MRDIKYRMDNAMTLKKINELVEKRDQLTSKEKEKLVDAILQNKKAKIIAMRGAIVLGKFSLATTMSFSSSLKQVNAII